MRLARASLAASSVVLLLACGSSPAAGTGGGGGGAGGGTDGRFHPPGNGTPMSETDACTALSMAQSSELSALSCTFTTQTCPALLRAQFTTACLQYDQGTVQGCVAYYAKATSCGALEAAITACAVMPIAGSAPQGCP